NMHLCLRRIAHNQHTLTLHDALPICYSGPTAINSSTLTASNNTPLGNNSAVTLANVAGVQLILNNSVSIGSLAGGGTTGGNVARNAGQPTVLHYRNNTTFGVQLDDDG